MKRMITGQGVVDMEVSAEMRKPAAQKWIRVMEETMALLGGVLAVINPATFNAGITCVKAMSESDSIAKAEHFGDILETWTSPYTAISLMSNRDTPLHRDNGGGYSYMDMLLSVSEYTHGEFHAPGLGKTYWYVPGTVIGICGRVVRHGAAASGERLCIAQYLRSNVMRSLGIPNPEWVNVIDLASGE